MTEMVAALSNYMRTSHLPVETAPDVAVAPADGQVDMQSAVALARQE